MIVRKIQKLEPRDISTSTILWALFQKSYKVEAELVAVSDFPPLRRAVEDFQESNTMFYGVLINEKLAAATEVSINEVDLEVCSLVVDPDFFRQGLARELLIFIEERFKPERSTVETAAVNIPAIKLYEKHGFVMTDQWMTSFGIEKVKLVKRKTSCI
ncbi:GNAT family N-acetyltransferase [Reichenbachiella sp.]|uniref:GNAT family N-acetyltransferase n=1 Tax=Reichenbachiella sp. TaxID=2184521 RepID=UPI003BAF0DEB